METAPPASFSAVVRLGFEPAHDEPFCAAGVGSLVAEVAALAEAMGCATGFTVEKLSGQARSQQRKTSIALDLELHRPIEFDAMFGAPLELARWLGVPTPTFDLLAGLVKLRAIAAGCYPAS